MTQNSSHNCNSNTLYERNLKLINNIIQVDCLIFEDFFQPRITLIYTNCIKNTFSNSCQLVKLVAITCFQYRSSQLK